MKPAVLSLVAVLLSGCTAFPELAGTEPVHHEKARYPRLVPVEPLLAAAEEVQITPETEAGIAARVAALRARAARLRGQVVDSGTRARMRAGVTGLIES